MHTKSISKTLLNINLPYYTKMALKADKLFELMPAHLEKNGAAMVKKLGFVYAFEVYKKKGDKPKVWTINLKEGNGSLHEGRVGKIDATFTLSDDDCVKLSQGKLNPQMAFVQGKMKIKGNMRAATQFTPDLLPKAPAL